MIVINTTVRSLKYNGNGSLSDGIKILGVHIDNMRMFLDNVIVCINRFDSDLNEEIDFINNYCIKKFVNCVEVSSFSKGSDGSIELAKKIIELSNIDTDFNFLYDLNDSVKNKIDFVCKKVYRASNVVYEDSVLNKIKEIDKQFPNLPICIAKTPYSLSSDPKKIGVVKDFDIFINDLKVQSGAQFIIVYLSSILTLPGLSENANMYSIKIDENLNIEGIR